MNEVIRIPIFLNENGTETSQKLIRDQEAKRLFLIKPVEVSDLF